MDTNNADVETSNSDYDSISTNSPTARIYDGSILDGGTVRPISKSTDDNPPTSELDTSVQVISDPPAILNVNSSPLRQVFPGVKQLSQSISQPTTSPTSHTTNPNNTTD